MSTAVAPSDVTQASLDEVLMSSERRQIYITPDLPTNTDTNYITYRFPAGINDLRGHSLVWDAVAVPNATGGSVVSFPKPFGSVIDRIVLRIGNCTVFDIQGYDVYAGIMEGQKSYDAVQFLADNGAITAAARQAQSVVVSSYVWRIEHELFKKVIPLFGAASLMELTLYPKNINSMLEYNNAPLGRTFSNMKLYFHQIVGNDNLNAMVQASIAAGTYQIPYLGVAQYIASLTSLTRQDVQLPFKYKVLRDVIVAATPSASITDGTIVATGSRLINNYPLANLLTAQMKAGSLMFPIQQYDFTSTNSYRLLKRSLNSVLETFYPAHVHQGAVWGEITTVEGNRVIQVYDCRANDGPNSAQYKENGYNNSQTSMPIIISTTYSVAPGAQTWFCYAHFESTLSITNNMVTNIC